MVLSRKRTGLTPCCRQSACAPRGTGSGQVPHSSEDAILGTLHPGLGSTVRVPDHAAQLRLEEYLAARDGDGEVTGPHRLRCRYHSPPLVWAPMLTMRPNGGAIVRLSGCQVKAVPSQRLTRLGLPRWHKFELGISGATSVEPILTFGPDVPQGPRKWFRLGIPEYVLSECAAFLVAEGILGSWVPDCVISHGVMVTITEQPQLVGVPVVRLCPGGRLIVLLS